MTLDPGANTTIKDIVNKDLAVASLMLMTFVKNIFTLAHATEEETVPKDILANVDIGTKEDVGEQTTVPIFTRKKITIKLEVQNSPNTQKSANS